MFGLSLHSWENLMVGSLAIAGAVALFVGFATWMVVKLQRQELAASRAEFETYKLDAGKRIATAEASGETARADAAKANAELGKSNERIAELNNDTEHLRADNVALQTAMLPRHIGLIGINGPPPAQKWFANFEAFAGTEIEIQVVAGDSEARNLANEITMVLHQFGWRPKNISETRSKMNDSRIPDGVRVSYPTGKPWTADAPNQPWFAWAKAAEALANALTNAGLSVGDRPVSRYGFTNALPSSFPGTEPFFDPPLEGIYLQVGARPIAETIEWIKAGRPDVLGNKPARGSSATPK